MIAHRELVGFSSNLPAFLADVRSLGFNWLLFELLVSGTSGLTGTLPELWLNLVVLTNLSSYGRTAMEIPVSKSYISAASALPRICASTSRLPRFHIGYSVNTTSETCRSMDKQCSHRILHLAIPVLMVQASPAQLVCLPTICWKVDSAQSEIRICYNNTMCYFIVRQFFPFLEVRICQFYFNIIRLSSQHVSM
jgi:hypothetical protein